MDLLLYGQPLHTRFQSIVARRCDDGELVAEGEHLDLRKRGFVPVGSDLQASGIIHQMNLRATLDLSTPALTGLVSGMAVPAFEPTALTGGETCRDIAGAHRELESLPLDASASRAVAGAMGGVRGCSHLLALTQLMASTMAHAVRDADGWQLRPASRLFHRSMTIDGAQPDDGTIELAVQLADIFFAPAAAIANPMDRFRRHYELRLLVRIDLGAVTLRSLEVAERTRERGDLAGARWHRRDGSVADLVGTRFLGGFARRVFEHFPDPAVDRPLVDALLGLAPAFIQVCACFSEDWPSRCLSADTLVGIGGIPDACYMWRRGGALDGRKKPTDPMGTI